MPNPQINLTLPAVGFWDFGRVWIQGRCNLSSNFPAGKAGYLQAVRLHGS